MASQQQNIDGSSIDRSNVQQNQAGRDAVSFLNSHDNQVIIENTFLKLFPQSDRSQVDWEWGLKLLEQKQLPEIRKRLTDTLGRDRILMDVSIEEQQKWVNRSPLAADRILQIDGKNCGILNPDRLLIETFGRDDIKGKLLILGAPGAGKTTALLSLAEQLVCGAISQPKTVIPVIFELSTWRDDKQSIQDWLIEQLYDLHGGSRKAKFYEQWLERQVLLPLLDGLDELGLERQKKCTQKLNEFAEHYPQMVVCCRVKEFEAVDIKLRNLRGAVCLQSLSDSQIQDYLGSLERPELWEAIQTTPYLQAMLAPTTEGDPGLLRLPLFVKLVADVYDPQQQISSKADLLDKYIDRQLSFDRREIDRRKELNKYKWEYKTVKLEPDWKKARSHLHWLAYNLQANGNVVFLIERMQRNLLDSWLDKLIYALLIGLFFGLAGGIIVGAIIFANMYIQTKNSTIAGLVSLIVSVFFAFFLGLWACLTIGRSDLIDPISSIRWKH
ncbi:NACHT domain-containing protein [Chamaesiphon sp. OTE_75_metabat_556]|uniref:NACHT domain-containing protein n=1 Tax=Chamaesiphon sp. OTE_75_metabat_556 TaxID=2964692 RepID=UPI00286AF41F|nr:NACHT domain-containing protein [Chamaesiphon sp. OTE_75_metabat_556]